MDQYLSAVRLFIDDVEKIIENMKEASGLLISNPIFNLKADGYELDDVSELMDLRRKEGTESVSRPSCSFVGLEDTLLVWIWLGLSVVANRRT